ncbi:hypothetical protein [Thalassotalea atypica]|uniref:hypothetical protein n=1 Tax=Thalassotalea atypica TaxID=2054316 RepID=UPI002574489D|nr:hypothetical protein [Thalassotalea atypica]
MLKFKKLAAVLVSFLLAMPTYATLITYTNQADFLTAIGGAADITEDFNSYATDQSFRNASFDVGPFTLSSTGAVQNSNTQNQIDALPFSFGNFANVNDTTFAHFFLAANVTTATIAFDDEITAFGAFFKELSSTTSLTLTTSVGVEVVTKNIGTGVAFFGFTLDPGITMSSMLVSTSSAGDGFGIDDVLLATSDSTTIPEPSSLILFLSALYLYRRKNA